MTHTPDMFDFLEDAGLKIDQAGRDLAEREKREVFERTLDEVDRDQELVKGLRRELAEPWGDIS